jgi:hypothetical protein
LTNNDLPFPSTEGGGIMKKRTGRLAQLVRAPPLQGGGRWFESNTAQRKIR